MDYTPQNDTTYVVEPKADPVDRIQVEVGDSKQPDAFHPQTKVMRWDNEVNLSARLIDHGQTNWDVIADAERIQAIGETTDIHFYEIAPNDTHPEGATELEIILKEKPARNNLNFSLRTKGLQFFYQPALTQDEIDNGHVRPDDIVGSYAVYTAEPKINFVGGKQYRASKVCHIPRPWIIDANGVGTWGDLSIEIVDDDLGIGVLAVTIPQAFLDNAAYPVRHAAGLTMGYTTAGGSTQNNSQTQMIGATGLATGLLTLSLISSYQPAGSYAGVTMHHGIYDENGLLLDYTEEKAPTASQWNDFNIIGGTPISANRFHFGLRNNRASSAVNIAYDASSGTWLYFLVNSLGTYAYPPPSSVSLLEGDNFVMSNYATYSPVPYLPSGSNSMQAILAQ